MSSANPFDSQEFTQRQPSWNGWDVIFLFLLYSTITTLSVQVTAFFADVTPAQTPKNDISAPQEETNPSVDEETVPQKAAEHPLTQLLIQGKRRPAVLLVTFLSAVVMAPLLEEFLFRVLLQGWIQGFIVQIGRQLSPSAQTDPSEKNLVPKFSGTIAIIATSLFFASLHGGAREEWDADLLYIMILGSLIGSLLAALLGLYYLLFFRRISAPELGLTTKNFGSDLVQSAWLFLICSPLIYLLHQVLRECFPERVTDPVPLFVFSLILGSLFLRTRRLTTCVSLHAYLNAFSFGMLLYQS